MDVTRPLGMFNSQLLIKCTSLQVPGTQTRTSCLVLTGLGGTLGNCGVKPVARFEGHTGDEGHNSSLGTGLLGGTFKCRYQWQAFRAQLSTTKAFLPLVYTDTVTTDLPVVSRMVELVSKTGIEQGPKTSIPTDAQLLL